MCKHHHLGNRVMFMTFWLKVEPNWPKHSVLGAGYNRGETQSSRG